jgi:hypothetical protein
MQQYPSRYYSNATKDLTCHNIYLKKAVISDISQFLVE